ncbi:MAG: septal ring lytic transglycosylase RlpA family lipoprotein [Chitinophagaceae bacterium]
MRQKIIALVLIVFVFSFSSFAPVKDFRKRLVNNEMVASISNKAKKVLYGTASYYAEKFNGRVTANGEVYNSKRMSAACNLLPLGSWIRVINLKNNKSLALRVNDRLHPKNKRVVDLSYVAAKKLGYIGQGLTSVRVEVINPSELRND